MSATEAPPAPAAGDPPSTPSAPPPTVPPKSGARDGPSSPTAKATSSPSRAPAAADPKTPPRNEARDQLTPLNTSAHKKPVTEFPELPQAPPSYRLGNGYSAAFKVPTVAAYHELQKQHEADADEYARIVEARAAELGRAHSDESGQVSDSKASIESGRERASSGSRDSWIRRRRRSSVGPVSPTTAKQEKERLMHQMNQAHEKPTDRLKRARKGERRVRDPITGGEIIVKDADPRDFDISRTATRGGNVLYNAYPPPQSLSQEEIVQRFQLLQYAAIGGMFVLWLFVAFGSGFRAFFWRSVVCGAFGAAFVTGISVLGRGIDRDLEKVRVDLSRARGEAFSPPMPESVEWLNGLIKLVWGVVDPQMFVPLADTVEDILQQSLPGFVDAVRITDIDQGTNPLRLTSIRALPDMHTDHEWPRTEWIDQGAGQPMKDPAGKELKEDQTGDYYNFECSFSYAALPGAGAQERAKNIHMLIEFFLGVYDWFHIPIPIWIQIEEIVGVVRLRVQFIPEPPYVRLVTFALCGVPAIDVSAVPLSRHLPSVLDLPFISSFVKSGIAAGTSELSVPKSMTLNLKDMLSGAQVGDTRSIGVFIVKIHYCVGLSAQDSNGLSDPYIVLAYANYGRPLYSTRIIVEDLNPVFEETAFLPLTMDEVRGKESVCLMLWDSDKLSADDLVGRVQVEVEELMKHPNQMFDREDGLKGFEDANEMPGKLNWSIGYFEKAALDPSLQRELTPEEAKEKVVERTPTSKEMHPYDAAPNPAKEDLPPPEPDLTKTRPDPHWPSGVLSIVLHQVNNLERQHLEGKSGKEREGEAGQDTDDPSEQTENLPSGYGEFIVNDELIYKTRVKQYAINPYFEAGTEVFIRDFTTTEVRVVIRDSRLREHDPIMGVVNVFLADIFADCSSVTRMFPIEEGVGFGKANISFAFRGMKMSIPPAMRGWDTGTLVVSNARLTIDTAKFEKLDVRETSLKLITAELTETMSKRQSAVQGGDTVVWDLEQVHLPIYHRYQASVIFEFGNTGLRSLFGLRQPGAFSVFWLQDIVDDTPTDIELPVIVSNHTKCLKWNYINDETPKHHEYEVIGKLKVRMEYSSGLDNSHEKLRLGQSRRHALEAWDLIEGQEIQAQRQATFMDDGKIDRTEKKEMKRAHKRQLESRGRGMAQLRAYRTAKWMTNGIKDRLPGKKKIREPTVSTEA
ncbi:hypothetical protein Q8F55_008956 [Vanrija albida]|uniref:C2 domain-containing protein n=1 Tax=Vanrija albida TaxID=181172 RepID=A0ABR3PSA6_9TREE